MNGREKRSVALLIAATLIMTVTEPVLAMEVNKTNLWYGGDEGIEIVTRTGKNLAYTEEDPKIDPMMTNHARKMDQALLLLGEGHGRRHMMFHYSGRVLGAIRYRDFKVHLKAGQGGLPGMDFYNVMRDPGEKFGQLYPGLFAVTPIQITLREHMRLIRKFPHRVSKTMPKGAELTPHD